MEMNFLIKMRYVFCYSSNGFVCLVFHKRDDNVIEMQQSDWSEQEDEVCKHPFFKPLTAPYTTFISE